MVILALPFLIAAAMLTSALIDGAWNIYQTDQVTKEQDKAYNQISTYQKGYYDENTRYFSEYIRRHHLEGREIVYPYRTGFNYDLSKMYSADANLVNNSLNRTGSYVRALTGGARAGSYLYNVK